MSNPRELWRPKLPEAASQCASCPFRDDNDAEFGAVMQRLRERVGMPGKLKRRDIAYAKYTIRTKDIAHSGDFACHFTAYDKDMNERPRVDHRQCPGATAEFKRQGASRT